MDEYQCIHVEKAGKIIRTSVHTFLSNYQYFTNVALIALPFSTSFLLLQELVPYLSLLPTIQTRLHILFYAAGFPPSSTFFTILSLKLSQTITSSIVLLPFTLSFLLTAKASIIQALYHPQKPSPQLNFSSFLSFYTPILHTQFCNSFFILSANAICFTILFIAFNIFEGLNALSSTKSVLFLSATAAVFYSIILGNALIISNLALVLSGMEKNGGYISILKAYVLMRGRNATALSLALPLCMALAATEALFQYRVVAAYMHTGFPTIFMALEWMMIAYLYSLFIVLDTIVSCLFFKSCKTAFLIEQQACRYAFRIDIAEVEGKCQGLKEGHILEFSL